MCSARWKKAGAESRSSIKADSIHAVPRETKLQPTLERLTTIMIPPTPPFLAYLPPSLPKFFTATGHAGTISRFNRAHV